MEYSSGLDRIAFLQSAVLFLLMFQRASEYLIFDWNAGTCLQNCPSICCRISVLEPDRYGCLFSIFASRRCIAVSQSAKHVTEIADLNVFFTFQVSRSIGDVYLKKPDFYRDPVFQQFGNPIPLKRPAMTAEPSILIRKLRPQDLFLIFASDGLWEQLTDEAAVEIVCKNPRAVSTHLDTPSILNRKWTRCFRLINLIKRNIILTTVVVDFEFVGNR